MVVACQNKWQWWHVKTKGRNKGGGWNVPNISGFYIFSCGGHVMFPNIYKAMRDLFQFSKVPHTTPRPNFIAYQGWILLHAY